MDRARAETEPNDNFAQAQRLTGPGPRTVYGVASGDDEGYSGAITVQVPAAIGSGTDTDWVEDLYAVTTTAPGLTAELSRFDMDLDLYVFTPDLTIVGRSNGSAATERVDLPALPAGTYYVGVSMYGEYGDASNRYDYSLYALAVTGALGGSTGAAEEALAGDLVLGAAYPNPSRDGARVPFTLARGGPVRLVVYDVLGREVARPVDGARGPGLHTAEVGAGLASGTYVVRLEADGRAHTGRFTVVR